MAKNDGGVNLRAQRLFSAITYGKVCRMTEMRKITAFLPAKLLASAQAYTGEGITETLRLALEELKRREWGRRALALEGKVKLDIDLEELRRDREFDEFGNVIR